MYATLTGNPWLDGSLAVVTAATSLVALILIFVRFIRLCVTADRSLGVLQRVSSEFAPNGGASLHDALSKLQRESTLAAHDLAAHRTTMEAAVASMQAKLVALGSDNQANADAIIELRRLVADVAGLRATLRAGMEHQG